ncbi:unnamed protein product [Boreogadus saida]
MPTEEEAPSITEFYSSSHVLLVGQTARFTCNASGKPEPTVEWLHNGRPLERDGTDNQSEAWVERGFLFVRGLRDGVNTVCCMASNSAGTANHTAELLVFDACDLTLDPNTAHGQLSLSEDNRKVTWAEYQSYPDHPDRFDSWSQVLGREALTGRCYWEVEWGGQVMIAVTYRGITRKGPGAERGLGMNNNSWGLYCSDGGYTAWYNAIPTYLPPPAGSTRVGVYLDRPAGSLSFYRVSPGGGGSSDTQTHLHTFSSSFTQEDLLLGVVVWTVGCSAASLSVTTVPISEPDPGLSEEPEDTSLDREETGKTGFEGVRLTLSSEAVKGMPRFRHTGCGPRLRVLHLETARGRTTVHIGSVMPTEEEAPSITEFYSSSHVLLVGQTARFTCHAGGTPEPTVEWLHNGRPLERDGTDNQSEAWVERGFLFVRGVRDGVNTVCCMASNSAGTANHTAELLVFDACDLTLDPNTAHGQLSLSEDNRKVTWATEYQSYPDHPDRFDSWSQVLGREALTGRCYWEVEWGGQVMIAVTYRGITRKGPGAERGLGSNNNSWGLYCSDDRYSAQYNGIPTRLPLPPAGSTRVGVYLDRPAGSLSFYRVSPGGGGYSDTQTHLHTFCSSFTQEDLLLGVVVWTVGCSASLCRL